jgi:hypothetical protein
MLFQIINPDSRRLIFTPTRDGDAELYLLNINMGILMITRTSMIVTKAQASFTELIDDQEGIILDLETMHYYTLNTAAVFLWKQMRLSDAATVEGLSMALADVFNINPDLAELDTRTFLDELEGNNLIAYYEFEGVLPVIPSMVAVTYSRYEPPQLTVSNSLTQVPLSGFSTIATAALGTEG